MHLTGKAAGSTQSTALHPGELRVRNAATRPLAVPSTADHKEHLFLDRLPPLKHTWTGFSLTHTEFLFFWRPSFLSPPKMGKHKPKWNQINPSWTWTKTQCTNVQPLPVLVPHPERGMRWLGWDGTGRHSGWCQCWFMPAAHHTSPLPAPWLSP